MIEFEIHYTNDDGTEGMEVVSAISMLEALKRFYLDLPARDDIAYVHKCIRRPHTRSSFFAYYNRSVAEELAEVTARLKANIAARNSNSADHKQTSQEGE